MPQALCQALPSLTRLTGLEVGPMVTADANNCLPTSLVDLKLKFCTIALPRPKAAKLAPSLSVGNAPGAVDSAHDSSADDADSSDGTWSNWVEEEEEQWEEVTAEQRKAARLLDLTSLPLLQSCQVMRIHPWSYHQDGYGKHQYTDLVTLRLVAPQLTRLLLVNHFKDVEGLQECTKLQDLALAGCAVNLTRFGQLVAGLTLLRIFFYHGDDVVEGGLCCKCLGKPVLWASVAQQQQLASAISGATQLTSLYIHGLSERGYVKVGAAGEVTLDEHGSSGVTDGEYKGWGAQVCSLSGLQQLVLDAPMPDADVLQLTQLTALTLLRVTEGEEVMVSDSVRDQVLSQMPRLQFNREIDVTLW